MIKVGEYVRTKKGKIEKIKTINRYGMATIYDNKADKISEGINYYAESGLEINQEDIAKHSKNIIDLIEVGDYVNGYKVSDKESTLLITNVKGIDRSGYNIPISQFGENIKTILTKEQYNANCYKVEE